MREDDKERVFRSHVLVALKDSPGWAVLHAEIKDRMLESYEKLERWMDSKPEMFTGKVAFRHAMRHKAYSELLDWIDGEISAGENLK